MKIPIYHLYAFTDKIFSGNPAAVCLLPEWLSDENLKNIAKENNLPVTAFLVRKDNEFTIRWITPEYELDLCGHGSLSAAFVIFNYLEPSWSKVNLKSRAEIIEVFHKNNLITLNFPAKSLENFSSHLLEEGLGSVPEEIYQYNNERCFLVYRDEEEIKQLKPNIEILKKLSQRGIIVTARGNHHDFVSRTFYPHKIIPEDPVTGASHCLLTPYWSKKLNKKELYAKQLSERGGEIVCEYQGDRVFISGKAVLYMQGMIHE